MSAPRSRAESDSDTDIPSKFRACLCGIDNNDVVSACTTALTIGNLSVMSINGSKESFRLSDDQIFELVNAIKIAEIPLEHLSLKNHRITDKGIEHISALVTQPPFIRGLDAEGNDFTSIAPLQIGTRDCFLAYLNISHNSISDIGGMEISEGITKNRTLVELYMNNCSFELTVLVAIITALQSNSNLQAIGLDRPLLIKTKQEEGTEHFSRVLLGASTRLAQISMRHHRISDFGGRLMADALSRNYSMLALDLECNQIGVAGAEALASYLILQSRKFKGTSGGGGLNYLQSLRLSHNIIGDEGAIALAEAIECSQTLKELTLKSNRIGARGLVALAKALNQTNTLAAVSLFGNDFEAKSGRMFLDLIAHRLPYVGISIDINVYVVDGVYMIAEL